MWERLRSGLLMGLVVGACAGTGVAGGVGRLAHAMAPERAIADPGLIEPDRPDQTDSPAVVAPGVLQIEAGLKVERQTDGSPNTTKLIVPDAMVRLGIVRHVELRLSGDGFVYTDRDGKGEPRSTTNGSDLDFGTKVRLWNQSGLLPAAAAIFSLRIPTGGSEESTDGVDPMGRLIAAWHLPRGLGLLMNLGFASETQGRDDSRRVVQTLPSAELTFPLVGRLHGYAEYFASLEGSNKDDQHSMDAGFMYLVNDNLQLDVYGGGGLTDAADDYFVGAGFSWRVGLWGVH